MLFKIQHGIVDISAEFVQLGDSPTRGSQRIRQLEANKDIDIYSFYPRTISDWNHLPISVTNSQSIQGLGEALAYLPHSIFTRYTEAVHSFNLGCWGISPVLSCVAVFTQGKLQSPNKIYTHTMEKEEEHKTPYLSIYSNGIHPHLSIACLLKHHLKVSKGAKIRNRYNQAPHLTQDTNGKVTNSQLDTTNESQEVSLFPAGDHKAHINRCTQRHSKHKTEQKHKRYTKEEPPWNGQ